MSIKEFEEYYQKTIAPRIQQWESYRRSEVKCAKEIKFLLFVSFLIWILIAIYSLKYLFYLQVNYDPFDYVLPYSALMLIFVGVCIYKLNHIQKRFQAFIEEEVFKRILSFYPNLAYFQKEGIEQKIIKETKLFANYDIFKAKNLIEGNVGSLNVEVSDLYLAREEDEYRDGKHYYKEVLVFKGFLLLSEISKNLSSTTYVLPDSIIKLFKGLPSSLSRVFLEDPLFEKNFDVYSDNQIEARYLLTTSFMDRLLQLNELRRVTCCFIGNKMYLAVWQEQDLLPEISLSQNISSEMILQIFKDFQIIFEILEILKIEMNIGL